MPKKPETRFGKKAAIATVSVAGIGLAGYLMLQFKRNHTKKRLLAAAQKVKDDAAAQKVKDDAAARPSFLPNLFAAATDVRNAGAQEKSSALCTQFSAVWGEVKAAYQQAEAASPGLTKADFNKNILMLTADERALIKEAVVICNP